MKRHLTASAIDIGARNETAVAGGIATRRRTPFHKGVRTRSGAGEANLALASVNVWMHTLILTGELNHRTAHALEAEIERLCEEGVTGITLDLRQLSHIDSTGVAVIAFRCDLCKRRGYDFRLIPGSRLIQRAFEQAGVTDMLPFGGDEAASPVPSARAGTALVPVGGGDQLDD